MNCFTHALPFMDDAYFMVGCCLPDWMSACDRKCRLREKKAAEFVDNSDPIVARVAQGVVQHHKDDGWFHAGAAFNELNFQFSKELSDVLDNDRSMRTHFVGHALIEMLLDACLHNRFPGRMDRYYQQVDAVDAGLIQAAINQFATRETDKLVDEITRFRRAKFLYDYANDHGIVFRMNKVLSRIGLETLPDSVYEWMPQARQKVDDRADDLLYDYSMQLDCR